MITWWISFIILSQVITSIYEPYEYDVDEIALFYTSESNDFFASGHNQ